MHAVRIAVPVLRIVVLIASTSMLLAPALARSGVDALHALRGTSRPVVILSDTRDDPRVSSQIAALDHAKPACDDRAIVVLREAEPGSRLRKTLGVEPTGFFVVLVGKDGSVKTVWRSTVDPHQIFSIIDQMPMRRREMRG